MIQIRWLHLFAVAIGVLIVVTLAPALRPATVDGGSSGDVVLARRLVSGQETMISLSQPPPPTRTATRTPTLSPTATYRATLTPQPTWGPDVVEAGFYRFVVKVPTPAPTGVDWPLCLDLAATPVTHSVDEGCEVK